MGACRPSHRRRQKGDRHGEDSKDPVNPKGQNLTGEYCWSQDQEAKSFVWETRRQTSKVNVDMGAPSKRQKGAMLLSLSSFHSGYNHITSAPLTQLGLPSSVIAFHHPELC